MENSQLKQIEIIIDKCIKEVKTINPTIQLEISYFKEYLDISMEKIIEAIEKYCVLKNVNVNILRSPSKALQMIKIKQFITNFVTEECNWGAEQYSVLFNIERSTYYNTIRVFRESFDVDKKYVLEYNSFKYIFLQLIQEQISIVGKPVYTNSEHKRKNAKSIIKYDIYMRELARYNTIHEASKKCNIPRGTIRSALSSGSPTYKKYIWKYESQINVLPSSDNGSGTQISLH